MSGKNYGRPLPPSRGRFLYKYEEVQKYEVSIFQLYDLMERFYLRKASVSDDEAKNYQSALEQKIKSLSCQQDKLIIDEKDEDQLEQDDQSTEEDPLLLCLSQIADHYKKRQTYKKEAFQKLKNEFQEELRNRFITHEYEQLSREIEKAKLAQPTDLDIERNTSNSLIEKEDIIIESTPNIIHTLRTGSYSAKKKMSQLEEKYKKLEKDLKTKNRKLEELDRQLKEKREELETKEQELSLKKDQIEEYLKELKEQESRKKTKNEFTQTEDMEEYSLLSTDSADDEEELESKEETSPTRGQKLLEQDFIRHGRKTWSDKEVKNFLRLLKKQNTSSAKIQPSTQIDTQKLTTEITATIKTIYGITQDLTETLTTYHNKITNELETVRNSKSKYTTFQTYQEKYQTEMHGKLKRLQHYCESQIDQIQAFNYEIQDNHIDLLRKQLIGNLNKQFQEQNQKLNEMLKTLCIQKIKTTQEVKPVVQKPKKLIIVPNKSIEVSQVTKIIREEAKKKDKQLEIKNIRRTKNNNIELKTLEKEVETISELLKNNSKDFEIINPEERKMKIILLRINKEFTKEELEEELSKRKYLNSFTIFKSLEIPNSTFNNWIIEAPAGECRKIVKTGKIKLFYEVIKAEFYIRVLRCTNCQELSNHTKSQCEFRSRCANCSGKHLTSECEENIKKCINCLRYNKEDFNHPAYSPQCPIFQYEKGRRLQGYYKSKPQTQNFLSKNSRKYFIDNRYQRPSTEDPRERDNERSRQVEENTGRREYSKNYKTTDKRTVKYRDVYINSSFRKREAQPPHRR